MAVTDETGFPRLGAEPLGPSRTRFCVWSPRAEVVEVELAGGRTRLRPGGDGLHQGEAEAGPGAEYRFVLDGGDPLPDPCSRVQPEGLAGPSAILDTSQLSIAPGPGLTLEELVIYELHVGTFSPEGTFDGVIPRLGELRELGVTAIELMPVATFPGRHGWGYDGVYAYATQFSYGGPHGLARLIDAAHRAGLGVILDVVYNHLGAGSDRVEAFGPYFTERYDTVWGKAIDYAQRAVREWAIQNAEMWVREFRVDGLRLDATHAIFDEAEPHVLRELNDRVKAIDPRALVISEMEIGDLRPIEQWGHDAQWEDALHHAMHVLLTGEREGYYRAYGKLADVARELRRPEGRCFIVCDQNHDQVGNRALGDRLRGRDLRLAAAVMLLSPGTPMLFQGEEYDESHPFLYFTDHIDPEIAEMTRQGRRKEFSEFSGFSAEEIPDPQDPATFERSKLDPADGDPEHLAYYRDLLALRREIGDAPAEIDYDEETLVLRMRRGKVELVANFARAERDGIPPRTAEIRR